AEKIFERAVERPKAEVKSFVLERRSEDISPTGDGCLPDLIAAKRPEETASLTTSGCRPLALPQEILDGGDAKPRHEMGGGAAARRRRVEGTPKRDVGGTVGDEIEVTPLVISSKCEK